MADLLDVVALGLAVVPGPVMAAGTAWARKPLVAEVVAVVLTAAEKEQPAAQQLELSPRLFPEPTPGFDPRGIPIRQHALPDCARPT